MSVTAVVASPCETLRAAYKAAKAALIERFETASNVDSLMQALGRATDDALKGAWSASDMPASATLVAVGGYGRGELAPYSDVDILVLLPDPVPQAEEADINERVERFIGMAWDLGLDIGSSVRSVEQCIAEAANDVTVLTSLLEARRLCGDAALFAASRSAIAKRSIRAPSSRRRCWRCGSVTRSSRTRRTAWSRTSRKARAACATCN